MRNDRIDRARQTNLEIWLRSRGEKLIRSGSEWRWVTHDAAGEHDSVTIRGNKWYDHKRGMGGDAISFAQTFYGLNFKQAATTLLCCGAPAEVQRYVSPGHSGKHISFILPERSANMHRAYTYLTQTRCLCADVVSHFVRAGSLFEDAKHHNVIFLGLDEHGVPADTALVVVPLVVTDGDAVMDAGGVMGDPAPFAARAYEFLPAGS